MRDTYAFLLNIDDLWVFWWIFKEHFIFVERNKFSWRLLKISTYKRIAFIFYTKWENSRMFWIYFERNRVKIKNWTKSRWSLEPDYFPIVTFFRFCTNPSIFCVSTFLLSPHICVSFKNKGVKFSGRTKNPPTKLTVAQADRNCLQGQNSWKESKGWKWAIQIW